MSTYVPRKILVTGSSGLIGNSITKFSSSQNIEVLAHSRGVNIDFNNFPILAVLDSNMTLNCPYNVALSSGLDALVHTFESFACNNSNEYTRIFAKEAFSLLFNNIDKALSEINNDEAREKMLFGAHLAGISLFNAGSGPAGALSYPLGVVFKIPHGIAGGLILPYLVKYNVDRRYYKYAELYSAAFSDNNETKYLTDKEKSERLVCLIFELYDKLKVWEMLNIYQIDLSSPKLIDYISQLQGAFNQNPISISTNDGLAFLDKIFNKQ